MPTSCVILAAGSSTRFGAHSKLLEQINGRSLVGRVCDAASSSTLDPIVLVVADPDQGVAAERGSERIRVVINPHSAEGQSTSIRRALESLPEETAGAVFLAADQPAITTELIDLVVLTGTSDYREDRPVICRAGERIGPPTYFPRRYFGQLAQLEGDEGGRQILRRLAPGEVIELEIEEEIALLDVDRPQDLERLFRKLGTPRNPV